MTFSFATYSFPSVVLTFTHHHLPSLKSPRQFARITHRLIIVLNRQSVKRRRILCGLDASTNPIGKPRTPSYRLSTQILKFLAHFLLSSQNFVLDPLLPTNSPDEIRTPANRCSSSLSFKNSILLFFVFHRKTVSNRCSIASTRLCLPRREVGRSAEIVRSGAHARLPGV